MKLVQRLSWCLCLTDNFALMETLVYGLNGWRKTVWKRKGPHEWDSILQTVQTALVSTCSRILPEKLPQWYVTIINIEMYQGQKLMTPVTWDNGPLLQPRPHPGLGSSCSPPSFWLCLCLAFPFKICSCTRQWWLVTMETTIKLFCSMSLKIAKNRQQQPLTYQRPSPSSSICSSKTHPLQGLTWCSWRQQG